MSKIILSMLPSAKVWFIVYWFSFVLTVHSPATISSSPADGKTSLGKFIANSNNNHDILRLGLSSSLNWYIFSGCKNYLASKRWGNDQADDDKLKVRDMNFTGRYRVLKNKALYCPIEKTASTTWNGILDGINAGVGKLWVLMLKKYHDMIYLIQISISV